jgi:hypothetical protein
MSASVKTEDHSLDMFELITKDSCGLPTWVISFNSNSGKGAGMKKLLIVLVESVVLTLFVTLMSQAYVTRTPVSNCRKGLVNLKRCVSKVEALRGSLPLQRP